MHAQCSLCPRIMVGVHEIFLKILSKYFISVLCKMCQFSNETLRAFLCPTCYSENLSVIYNSNNCRFTPACLIYMQHFKNLELLWLDHRALR